jgi:hypothetical protein
MDDARARELFEEGRGLFEEGRYPECILVWRESYLMSHRSGLLYNLAEAEERAQRYDEAVVSLEGYLASGEQHAIDHQATIRQRIERLRELAEQSPAPPPLVAPTAAQPQVVEPDPPPTPPTSPTPQPRPRVWTWVAVGLTGAFAIGAAVTGALTLSRRNDLEDLCGGRSCPPAYQPEWDSAWTLAITTDVLIGLAAASAVATILLIFLENRSSRRAQSAGLSPVLGLGMVGVQGSF